MENAIAGVSVRLPVANGRSKKVVNVEIQTTGRTKGRMTTIENQAYYTWLKQVIEQINNKYGLTEFKINFERIK